MIKREIGEGFYELLVQEYKSEFNILKGRIEVFGEHMRDRIAYTTSVTELLPEVEILLRDLAREVATLNQYFLSVRNCGNRLDELLNLSVESEDGNSGEIKA